MDPISVKFDDKFIAEAKLFSKHKGFDSFSAFIRYCIENTMETEQKNNHLEHVLRTEIREIKGLISSLEGAISEKDEDFLDRHLG